MEITLHIPGSPIGKGRPRHALQGGIVRTYTPAKTARYEAFAASLMAGAWEGREPLREPVSLSIVALFPRPKRLVWKTKPMPRCPHIGKPDTDNIVKSICDSLEKAGIVANDSVIWSVFAEKFYASGGEGPSVFVHLTFAAASLKEKEAQAS